MPELIDITVPITTGMPVWPGDPEVVVESISEGHSSSVSQLVLSTHTGTHIDPPRHFIKGGAAVDELPMEWLVGPAWVAHIPSVQAIGPTELEAAGIPKVERLLLKTSNTLFWPPSPGDEFRTEYAHLSPEGAQWVVERGIRLIGIDYLSIAAFRPAVPEAHLELLSAGVVILEGADLSQVEPGAYQLICLPLKVARGDGAPVRAVLVRNAECGVRNI